jgi:hypothetical protein
MKTASTVTIGTIDLGNGHVGITINGDRVERLMTRNNGTHYWVAESYNNLKEIKVTEIDSRWPLPFMNGIGIDGVIAVNTGTTIINNTDIRITYSDDSYAVATYSATSVSEEVYRYCGHEVRRMYRDMPTVSKYVPLGLHINSMFSNDVLKKYKKIEGFIETMDRAFDVVETSHTYTIYGWGNNPDMYVIFMKERAAFEIGGHGNRYDKPKRLSPFKL